MEHKPDFNLLDNDPEKLKGNPFKTPHGYFNNLTPRLVQIAIEKEKTSGVLESLLNTNFLAPAFSIAVIAVIAFYIVSGNSVNLDQQFTEMAIDLQFEQLAMLDEVDPIDLIETDLIYLGNITVSNDDDITDYLIDNDVKLSTLVDETPL